MELFTVDKENYLASSHPIVGIDSVLWVERYNSPSEFTITGEPRTLMEQLPIGRFISHSRTYCVMEVEEHYIDETQDGPPKVIIKGRDVLTVIMENRVTTLKQVVWSEYPPVGDVFVDDTSGISSLFYTQLNSWDQVYTLLDQFLKNTDVGALEDLPNVNVVIHPDIDPDATEINGTYPIFYNLFKLSTAVYKCLRRSDLGLRVVRPDLDGSTGLTFLIHLGTDLSDTITLSNLENARYFSSNRNFKTGFYYGGRGFDLGPEEVISNTNSAYTIRSHDSEIFGWDTRMFSVYDPNWDRGYFVDDALAFLDLNVNGLGASKEHLYSKFIEAPVNPRSPFIYGINYLIGDILWINGNYEVGSPMRLVEYTIAIDKDDESFIETFAPVYFAGFDDPPEM